MRFDELQDRVKEYQTGQAQQLPDWLDGWDSGSPTAKEDMKAKLDSYLTSSMGSQGRMRENAIGQLGINLEVGDISKEVLDSGYGKFRGDYDTSYDIWKQDPTNYRANAQTPIGKLGNGLAKMVPYAATTYLDNTVGLIMGIGNLAKDTFDGGEWHPINSLIDTPFANMMQDVRDWSEQVLPNYRTTEETEDSEHWWRHMNANFWGDTVLKNLGFTIGAALSGLTYVKGFEALQGKMMRNAYKSALAAAVKDSDAIAGWQKILQGGVIENPKAAYEVFGDMRKAYSRLGWQANLVGGIGGAIGESRVEAINASREHIQNVNATANDVYERGKQELIQRISSIPEFLDENGDVNYAGQAYYASELNKLQQRYKETMAVAEDESRALANTVFFLNMPLLTASNIIMFGKMYSGGYNSQAKTAAKGVFGSFTQKATKADFVLEPLKNTLSEGLEELSQKIFSEGAKDIASQRMAYFHDRQYDKKALRLTTGWLTSMLQSAQNVILDPTSWEEFAVGALTGALGMPSSHGWSGGIIGGVQEAKHNYQHSKEMTDELNKAVNDSNFKRMLLGMTRIVSEEEDKEQELKNGNEFAWHTLNDEQMLSTVMLFSRAGMLEELQNYVDSFKRIDENNVGEFRKTLRPDIDSDILSKSDAELVSWLHERADQASTAIKQYNDFYGAIDFMSFGTQSESAIEELIFTEAQLQNFEKRYNELLDKVWAQISPRLVDISKETDPLGTPTKRAEKAQELLNKHDLIGSIFGGMGLDIRGLAQDKTINEQYAAFKEIDDVQQQAVLDTLEELGTFTSQSGLKQQVEDLQKLVRARQDFYTRLFDPMNKESFAERHEREAKTDDDAANSLKGDMNKKKVDDFVGNLKNVKTFNEFYSIYNGVDNLGLSKEEYEDLARQIDEDDVTGPYYNRLMDALQFLSNVKSEANTYLENIPETDTELRGPWEYLNSVVDDMMEDMSDDIAELKDDDDISLYIAAKIMQRYKPDSVASRQALNALQKVLNDKNLAEKLGMMPSPPPQAPQPPSPPQREPQKPGDTYDKISKKLNSISDVNDTYLRKIVDGDFTGIDGLTDQEKENLVALAKSVLSVLENEAGMIGSGSDASGKPEPSDVEEKRHNKEFVQKDVKTLRGYAIEFYNIVRAKLGFREKKTSNSRTAMATLKWMDDHKVQQFIDSGALAALNDYYLKNNKKLPIYLLANPHYIPNNLMNNPFTIRKDQANVLYAIEMTDENREVLKAFETAGVFNDDTLVTVNDGGKQVQYLVIGEVFNPDPNSEWFQALPDDEKKLYLEQVKPNANLVWDYAVKGSVFPQYNNDIEKGTSAAFGPEGRWYVAKNNGDRISTTINYIMPGRSETRDNVRDIITDVAHKRPLGAALQEYKKYGLPYHFALNTYALGTLYTKGSPGFSTNIKAPVGSLWIATKLPNGAYDWSYVRVARTDEMTKDVWMNSDGILGQIRTALDTILKPLDRESSQEDFRMKLQEKRDAANVIRDLIYLGKGNTLTFNWDANGYMWVAIGDNMCVTVDDAINALRAGRYRFQVGKIAMSQKSILDQFADEGLLMTDKVSFINIGASFGLNVLTDKDSDGKKGPLHAEVSDNPVAFVPGSDKGNPAPRANIVDNIPIKRSSYSINLDTGEVLRKSKAYPEGVPETRSEVVAQVQTLAELMTLNGREYPGVHRIKTTSHEHTELFERTIDGITVRVMKKGANGGYMLCYDSDAWSDMVEGSVLVTKEEAPIQETTPVPEQVPSVIDGSIPPVSTPNPTASINAKRMIQGPGRPKKTVEEKVQDDDRLNDTIEC